MNTTLQTLGRVAIIGGGVLVSLVNVYHVPGVEALPPSGQGASTATGLPGMALLIPADLGRRRAAGRPAQAKREPGTAARARLRRSEAARAARTTVEPVHAAQLVDPRRQCWSSSPSASRWGCHRSEVRNQEIIFVGSFAIIAS
jgi:hypothetical protein